LLISSLVTLTNWWLMNAPVQSPRNPLLRLTIDAERAIIVASTCYGVIFWKTTSIGSWDRANCIEANTVLPKRSIAKSGIPIYKFNLKICIKSIADPKKPMHTDIYERVLNSNPLKNNWYIKIPVSKLNVPAIFRYPCWVTVIS